MSTDDSLNQIENVESRLEDVLSEFQQKHRYAELDEIADQMEATLLQQTLADALFEESVAIDEGAQGEVQDIKEYVQRGDIGHVESKEIASLRQTVTAEEQRITERIQSLRYEHKQTVRAFVKLNEEVNAVDAGRLSALQSLLEYWDWEDILNVDDDASLDEKIDEAVEAGTLMHDIYDEAIEAFGKAFGTSEAQEQVDTLINGSTLQMDSLSEEELVSLLDSKVSPYIALSLSDPE